MLHKSIEIWEKGTYLSEGDDGFYPILKTYILDGDKKRPAILICPGGGYKMIFPRETEAVAAAFTSIGYHAFILHYSTAPRRHPQPLMGVSRAMCILRERTVERNILPDKIAVCGFSAGGHLAASLGVHWDKPYLKNVPGLMDGQNRPDALILCYPVISSGEFANQGSVDNLLGEDADRDLLHEMSLEYQITGKTPPTFLWHTLEDVSVPVENSMLFSWGLKKNNISFELHLYHKEPHGFSLATRETQPHSPENPLSHTSPHVATWLKLCTEWLDEVLFIK